MSNSLEERNWDFAAESWSRLIDDGKDFYKDRILLPATMTLLPTNPASTIRALDLCCGEGYYSRALLRRGYSVVGVDVSENMIQLAKIKAPSIPYFKCDAQDLHLFVDQEFDVVLCGMAMQDIPHYDVAISEVRRVLRRGGTFVFSISHPCFSFEKAGGWQRDDSGAKKHFKMDRYFDEDFSDVPWSMPRLLYPFMSRTYHRPLSTYANALIKSGFKIVNLVEPRWNGPENDFPESARIGYFLLFECESSTSELAHLSEA